MDTREKKPWTFDDSEYFDSVLHEKLEYGDYSLKGFEDSVVIERKNSLDELYMNFSTKENRARIEREFERMKDVRYKYIFIEEDLGDILNHKKYKVNKLKRNRCSPYMPPALVLSAVMDASIKHNIHVWFVGNRGKTTARKLLIKVYDELDSRS